MTGAFSALRAGLNGYRGYKQRRLSAKINSILTDPTSPDAERAEADFLKLQSEYPPVREYGYDLAHFVERAATRISHLMSVAKSADKALSILELGGGDGMMGALLSAAGHSVTLSDIEDWRVDAAKHVKFIQADCTKGIQAELAPAPHLYSLCASAAHLDEQPEYHRQQRYRLGGTPGISLAQATNIIEAVKFAKLIGLPLVAHLTLHWAYINVGDDPDGKRFAKVREGFAKWLHRHGIVFAAVWCIERMSRGQAEVVHCHLLFHLPVEYRAKRLLQVEAAIFRLVKRHGGGYWADEVIKLTVWPNPDGKYLVKGGGPKVWKLFRLRKEHRRLQGIIFGKRCGVTQNIGRTARHHAAWPSPITATRQFRGSLKLTPTP